MSCQRKEGERLVCLLAHIIMEVGGHAQQGRQGLLHVGRKPCPDVLCVDAQGLRRCRLLVQDACAQ